MRDALRRESVGEYFQVVIPAYNEAESLPLVIEAVPREVAGIPLRILVVDDGSTDRTPQIARDHGVDVIQHDTNRGQGTAIMTGFSAADRQGCIAAISLDADGQHDPGRIESILQPIIANRADFVLGSRFRGFNASNDTERALGIHLLSSLVSMVIWQRITDATNGFRALRREYLSLVRTIDERFNSIELLIRAKKLRLRIAEVPVRVRQRTSGHTKKPRVRYFLGLIKAMIRGIIS